MIINQKFFISGFQSLWHRAPNMDTLVALGAGASFGYSVYALFAMTDAQMRMDMDGVMAFMHEFYFESAAMILTLITVGKMLEARSKGKTTDALKSLMRLAPKKAVILKNGEEQEVSIEQVKKGDLFVVRPGENIPVDGIVVDGSSAVNEAALTGESIPVDKEAGDHVSAATLNQSGFLKCEALRVGEDTTLSQIIQMVSDAAATKAPIAKVADRVSGVFVPIVIGIAAMTIAVWLLAGASVGFALARGISVLVISCPCALGLATPVAIMVGNGMGAKNGIMFKTAVSLEETGKVEIVALDKTGTITSGEPKVTDLLPVEGTTEEMLLSYAYALERKSEHPLAAAVIREAEERHLPGREAESFQAVPGGNLAFIRQEAEVSEERKRQAERLASDGKTPLFFSLQASGGEQELLGIIAVADVIKEDSPRAIRELQNMGIRVVMLTGDNEATAREIARKAGILHYRAGVLPQDKAAFIGSLQKNGRKVAMAGDGINDSAALAQADLSIAMGGGSDIAMDVAKMTIISSDLTKIPEALKLSRLTVRTIRQNLFWAFIYNIIGVPVAAGVLYPVNGFLLNPMIAGAAMAFSSVSVVTNSLRLKRKKIETAESPASTPAGQPENKVEPSTENVMKKEFKVEGMMCNHCRMHVEKALNSMEGVHATVTLNPPVAVVEFSEGEKTLDELQAVVTAQAGDYTLKE